MSDLIDVRPSHAFDVAALSRWMADHVESFRGPLGVRQFAGGQSNPTFLVEAASGDYVLRKKPPGPLLPSAHMVEREFRVMRALSGSAVPVPRVHALCEDAAVIGTPFFVMERVPGRVFWDPLLPELTAAERRAIYERSVDVLVALHAISPETVGLGDFGRPGGYFARQVARWTQQYEAARTADVPSMSAVGAWLAAHVPPGDDEATLVHGDFRLDNLIVHPVEPRVVAVVDWELSTLGHPLADLSYACLCYYVTPQGAVREGPTALSADGVPRVEEQVARYEARSGRHAWPHWRFHVAFSLYRLAAIAQGVYRRGLQGNASSTAALCYEDAARRLSGLAAEIVGG